MRRNQSQDLYGEHINTVLRLLQSRDAFGEDFFIVALSNDEIPFNFSARVTINNLSSSV